MPERQLRRLPLRPGRRPAEHRRRRPRAPRRVRRVVEPRARPRRADGGATAREGAARRRRRHRRSGAQRALRREGAAPAHDARADEAVARAALTVLGAAVRAAEGDPLTALAAADVPPPLHLDPRLVVAMARELGSRRSSSSRRVATTRAGAPSKGGGEGEGDEEGGAPRVAAFLHPRHAPPPARAAAARAPPLPPPPTLHPTSPHDAHPGDPRPAPRRSTPRSVRCARLGAEVMRVAPSLEAEPRATPRAWCPSCSTGAARARGGRVPIQLGPLRGGAAVLVAAASADDRARADRLARLGALGGRRRAPRRRRRHRRGAAVRQPPREVRPRPARGGEGASATRGRRPSGGRCLGLSATRPARGDARRAGAACRRRGRASVLGLLDTVAVAPPGLGGFGGSGTGFKLDFAKLVKEQQAQQARARSQSGGGTAKGKGAGRWGDMTSRREKEKAAAAALARRRRARRRRGPTTRCSRRPRRQQARRLRGGAPAPAPPSTSREAGGGDLGGEHGGEERRGAGRARRVRRAPPRRRRRRCRASTALSSFGSARRWRPTRASPRNRVLSGWIFV